MKRKIYSIIAIVILLFFGLEILTESKTILEAVAFSFNIWVNSIFPSLFPFFVISEFLIRMGFPELLGELLRPFMNKVFKIKGEAAFVFVLSLLSGFPSSAKYTKELVKRGTFNDKEGTKLLTFTHFSNPLFILGTVSILFLNNQEVGFLILFSHYITNIIIGFIFRNYDISEIDSKPVSIRRAINSMHQKRIANNQNFGEMFSEILMNSIQTLLLILGTITCFLIITTIINNNIPVNEYNQSIMSGIFEMTQGLKYVSLLAIPLKYKAVLSTFFLSFGGLCVHMQINSIISSTKMKYFPFLVARILHGAISSILVFYIFDIWTKYII